MKTIIYLFGEIYYLWIKGTKDRETGEYQDWCDVWNSGGMLNLAFHITQEEDKDAPRLTFQGNDITLLPADQQGSVFGYIWCTREAINNPRGNYPNGLVGMRYGWEKANNTVFSDASSLEFKWKQAVSKRIHQFMKFKDGEMQAPAGMQQSSAPRTLPEIPGVMRAKIDTLSFHEKMQRYVRKPTTKVYAAIIEEFTGMNQDKQQEVTHKILNAGVMRHEHISEIVEEFMTIAPVTETTDSELPQGL